jgi:hypothetical protein
MIVVIAVIAVIGRGQDAAVRDRVIRWPRRDGSRTRRHARSRTSGTVTGRDTDREQEKGFSGPMPLGSSATQAEQHRALEVRRKST